MKPAFLKAGIGCSILALLAAATLGVWSCGTAQTPVFVRGPGISGDVPPEMTILVPAENLTRGQGEFFRIRWTDRDPDSNAKISFALVNTAASANNARTTLVEGIDENDTTGPDSVSIGTSLVPVGNYNLLGTIDDGVNTPAEVFAMTNDAVPQRVILTIVGPGEGSPTVPPAITVIEPAFNRSVTQDDDLLVVVQPTELDPDVTKPYDPDSDVTIFILLDLDQDPNNDDPATPDPSKIILLDTRDVVANAFNAETFARQIDLSQIPPRPGGQPYFVRATIDDGTNPRVHQYAVGTISVVQLAAGEVDLFGVGKDVSGARVTGFGPGANLGSAITSIGDFDADGVDDFAIVARFGNPRNAGLVGEAYLIYGPDQTRFGGDIAANSIGEAVPGVIMEAPPVRSDPRMTDRLLCIIPEPSKSQGITDISSIRDISGDGRPEIMVGMSFVHGAFDGMDYDPGDQPIGGGGPDDTTAVEVAIRQGQVTVQEGNGAVNVTSTSYRGVIDGTIDAANPSATLNEADSLAWQDDAPGQRKWSLIKFQGVLDELPDTLFGLNSFIDVSTVTATLELRVFKVGGQGDVFQAVTDFTGQTRYDNFANGGAGGDPQIDVDYIRVGFTGEGKLGTVDGTTPETATVDVTLVVQSLINGELLSQDEELRFIIVHDGEPGGEAGARTSEFALETERPVLRINYDRVNLTGARGCYPDLLVNNLSDDISDDALDEQYYAGGMVTIIDSSNRDNRPRLGEAPDRLENTVITLELVGQQNRTLDTRGINEATGGIFARADDYIQTGRIAGARIIAGPFDCVNHEQLNQPPRTGLFGEKVSSIGDLNNDGLDEIIISAPQNERYIADLGSSFGPQSSHLASSVYRGSIAVVPGANYNAQQWRELTDADDSNSIIPRLDQQQDAPFGICRPAGGRTLLSPPDSFEVFAEKVDDMLGGAESAGDFNQDGLDDILCGAPLNDRSTSIVDSGAVYILYGRNVLGDFRLANADDPLRRSPMLRIRGEQPGDQIGWRQSKGLDVNGDRIDDVFISSPRADFGGVTRSTCVGDFNNDGVINETDLSRTTFNNCQSDHPDGVFSDEACKVFDYDNDGDIGDDDRELFLSCVAEGNSDCCANLVDNGFVGVIFGGVSIDGDRTISQIGTPDLPGVRFFGAGAGHRAGVDVSSAGDFNQDGFGDILIAVPGETRLDRAGRPRLGVVYLVFGGTHLANTEWSLDQVGSADLPGIVFLSPYEKGRPNEAAPEVVSFIGDINRDGFGDICIGNPKADFIDLNFPQGPDATDATLGRRRDAGDAYIIYGNNFGANRGGGA